MDQALLRRLLAACLARQGQLRDDLARFVEFRTGPAEDGSTPPDLDRFRAHMRDRLIKLGASCHEVPSEAKPGWLFGQANAAQAPSPANPSAPTPPTLIARRLDPTGRSGSRFAPLITGHLDTVHPMNGAFSGLRLNAEGTIGYGPGVVDMKGGLAIAINALEVLAEAGIEVPWSVLLNSDEETGSYASDNAIRAEAALQIDGRPAYSFGLALEPAMTATEADRAAGLSGRLAVVRGGSGQFQIVSTGKRAHVGRDFASGVSAVTGLCRAILQAHELSRPSEGICVNISPLHCPDAPNVVAGVASAWGNARYPDPEAGAALQRQLTAIAHQGGLPSIAVQTSFNRPAKPLRPDVQRLAERYQAVCAALDKPIGFGQTAGVCDGNNMQAAGLPTIDTVGVRGGGLHTTDEWIELDSLVDRCAALAMMIATAAAHQLD